MVQTHILYLSYCSLWYRHIYCTFYINKKHTHVCALLLSLFCASSWLMQLKFFATTVAKLICSYAHMCTKMYTVLRGIGHEHEIHYHTISITKRKLRSGPAHEHEHELEHVDEQEHEDVNEHNHDMYMSMHTKM